MVARRKKTSQKRNRFEIAPSRIRSAVANGSRLLHDLDGRSAPARRYRDITADIIGELGGRASISEMELHLIRNAAGLITMREALDAKILEGDKVDVACYCRITNSLRRVLESLGLQRRVIDVTDQAMALLESDAA